MLCLGIALLARVGVGALRVGERLGRLHVYFLECASQCVACSSYWRWVDDCYVVMASVATAVDYVMVAGDRSAGGPLYVAS